MHPADLLGKSFACECGKTHSIPIHAVVYCTTAIQQLPAMLDRHFAGRRINLVADERTYPLVGRECETILNQAGRIVRAFIVPDGPQLIRELEPAYLAHPEAIRAPRPPDARALYDH